MQWRPASVATSACAPRRQCALSCFPCARNENRKYEYRHDSKVHEYFCTWLRFTCIRVVRFGCFPCCWMTHLAKWRICFAGLRVQKQAGWAMSVSTIKCWSLQRAPWNCSVKKKLSWKPVTPSRLKKEKKVITCVQLSAVYCWGTHCLSCSLFSCLLSTQVMYEAEWAMRVWELYK